MGLEGKLGFLIGLKLVIFNKTGLFYALGNGFADEVLFLNYSSLLL